LSRKEVPNAASRGADVRVVNYDDVESLKAALQGVHTVLSFILDLSEAHVTSQVNLIQAAVAIGVQRFVPSEWAVDVARVPVFLPLYDKKQRVRDVLEKTSLEYTYVAVGLFMDYLLPIGAKKYFRDYPTPVDVQNRKAHIPGTGEAKVSLTTGDDIARAVGVLLDTPKWEKYIYIVGETTTWNNVVKLAENVTGAKFAVTYEPEQQIKERIQNAGSDMFKRMYAEMDLVLAEGTFECPARSKAVDTFHYTSVAELLKSAYAK